MCYRAMRALFGCSMDLLASVAGTYKAKASPNAHRAPRLGVYLTYTHFLLIFSNIFLFSICDVGCFDIQDWPSMEPL